MGVPKKGAGVNQTKKGAGAGKNPGGSGHIPVGKGGKGPKTVTPSQGNKGTAGKAPTKG